ncbi:MAG TPA: CAP domain-containing protein [Cytophagales bacterium]|nr:CAP domain-containing protein [Cytophagales bacterium]HAA18469.1 CAP domain-containing protein [Cytophagales bacterium]
MHDMMIKKVPLLFLVWLVALSAHAQYRNAPAQVDEQKILELVNEVRAKGCRCGRERMAPAPALTWNSQLEQAAQGHSNWMDDKGRFSHTGRRRSNTGQRVEEVGYSWNFVGENIAAGQITEEAVMESWLKSPGHCKNIMNPNFTQMAVATSGPYWTQVFARPSRRAN